MSDNTRAVTIAGEQFEFPVKYHEGHQLTEIEAKVLSQTWCENVRNNTAKFIKAANDPEDEMTMEDAHAAGSAASLSPEEKEARKIAREWIRAKLKQAGRKVGEIAKEQLAEAVETLAASDEVVKLAKKRVKEAAAASEVALEGLGLGG